MPFTIFNCPLFTFPKKKKIWNLDIIGYLVIGAGCWIKKDLEPSPSLPNCSKDYLKLLPLLMSINWPSLVTSWVVVQKKSSKMYLVSFTNSHCDVTDTVIHGMVKNTKPWISWERNISFLWNQKILNLCHRWHNLRSYCFVAEVTFNKNNSILNVAHLGWETKKTFQSRLPKTALNVTFFVSFYFNLMNSIPFTSCTRRLS